MINFTKKAVLVMDGITIKPVAYIKNDYKEKFGVPRQCGLAPSLKSHIVFCPEFRVENMINEHIEKAKTVKNAINLKTLFFLFFKNNTPLFYLIKE